MKKQLLLLLSTFVFSGCSIMAPTYTPSVKSVQAIKNSNAASVNVAKATAAKPGLNKVSLRGNTLNSPYGDYSSYLEQALKKELTDAGLLDTKSNIVIGTQLTKNDIDPSISKGKGDLAARFTVVKNDQQVFEKEIAAHEEWESSFVGAIAIPNAINAYPTLVNQLVTNLFSDREFLKSISK